MSTTIVGAGPIGSFVAMKLAKKGISVNVVEEHNSVGLPLQCTGLVSYNLKHVINFPDSIIVNKINEAKFFFPDSEPIIFKGKAIVLDRVAFDGFMYEKASFAGANFSFNEKYESFSGGYLLKIKTNKRDIKASMLVGADGPFSIVGQQIGSKNNCIPAVQVRCRGQFNPEQVELHFGSKFPGFFAWVVPENGNIARVGVASKEKPGEKLKSFLTEKGILKFIDKQGGSIPIGWNDKIVDYRVALVGDAASQTKATTGGGLVTGLESAKILTRAIKKAYESEDFSKEFFQEHYVNCWKRGIGKDLRKAYFLRKVLDYFSDNNLKELADIISDDKFKQQLEKNVDMEQYSKFLSKILFNPAILWLGIKIVARNPFIIQDMIKILV